MYAFSTWKIRRFRPTTNGAFRDYVNKEIHFVRLNLVEGKVTGRVFHEMRKVISRQVALYDNLKILYPSAYHQQLSRYLSTINGLMGSMHDELIAMFIEMHITVKVIFSRLPTFCWMIQSSRRRLGTNCKSLYTSQHKNPSIFLPVWILPHRKVSGPAKDKRLSRALYYSFDTN